MEELQYLESMIEEGSLVLLDLSAFEDLSVAMLLKRFLRQLPIPLLSIDLYQGLSLVSLIMMVNYNYN